MPFASSASNRKREQPPRSIIQTSSRFMTSVATTTRRTSSVNCSKVGRKWQVSTSGGASPRWRRDGKELFYLSADNTLMAVEVNGHSSVFEIRSVRPLFDVRPRATPFFNYGSGYNYDVSADGQRFLVSTVTEPVAPAPITIVMNWNAR